MKSRIEILDPFTRETGMVVCVPEWMSDEGILAWCNQNNKMSDSEWSAVLRHGGFISKCDCDDHRIHIRVIAE